MKVKGKFDVDVLTLFATKMDVMTQLDHLNVNAVNACTFSPTCVGMDLSTIQLWIVMLGILLPNPLESICQ